MPATSEKRRRRFGGWLVVALVALPAIALAAYIVSANLYVTYDIGTPPTITIPTVSGSGEYLNGDSTTSGLPGTLTCDFAGGADLDVDFQGFFPGEACIADITISSSEPLTNLRIEGAIPELQIHLTDGPDYWNPTSSADLAGAGPYTWTGKVVVRANASGSGTAFNGELVIDGDLTR